MSAQATHLSEQYERGLRLLATGLVMHLWRLWLGTSGFAVLAGMILTSAGNGANRQAGEAPALPGAFLAAGVLFASLVLAAIGLELVGSLFCGQTPAPGRRAGVIASVLFNLAAVATLFLVRVIDPRNDLHFGIVVLCSVLLVGIGGSLFVRFLVATGQDIENPALASYARGTRKLWHFVVPMALATIVLATLDALGPGVFRVYLILLLIPTLSLGAWFWVRSTRTLLRVREAVLDRARHAAELRWSAAS